MKKNAQKQNLGQDPVGPLLLKLAVPTIIAQLVNLLYNLVDRIYIGHIPDVGGMALTGLGLCFPVIMMITAFSSLIGAGGAPRAAIFMGKGNMDSAEQILGNCTAMLLGISIALTVILEMAGPAILWIFGASDNTFPYAISYMRIYVFGTVCVMMTLGLNMFVTTQGFFPPAQSPGPCRQRPPVRSSKAASTSFTFAIVFSSFLLNFEQKRPQNM